MHIIHVITRLIVGGAQENTLLSCEGQHDRGHEVTLITGPTLGPEGSLMKRAKEYGYRVEVVDEMRRSILPVRDFRTYKRLTRRFAELKPDIVHTHSSKAGIVGRWAADRAKVPLIVHTIHGLSWTASKSRMVNTIYRQLERQAAPITDVIVCVARAMAEQSIAAGIGRPGQYAVVYSGMRTAEFVRPPVSREKVRQQLGIREDDVVVGTIARLFHLKGHDDLLDAAPALCARHPRLKFLWVGDGVLRDSFELRIDTMGLRDRFVLTGLVQPGRIPELAGAMDILAHPSRREGLARALPQGSLAGCPTVTYDIDGNREALEEGVSGYAIPAFDAARFADAIARLIEEPHLRKSMGDAGRRLAQDRFDAKVMVDALERVYRMRGASKSNDE